MTYLVLFFKINIKNGGKNMNTAKDGFKILSSKKPRIEIPRDPVCNCHGDAGCIGSNCHTGNDCTINTVCTGKSGENRPGF